jgi:hypothetical protein
MHEPSGALHGTTVLDVSIPAGNIVVEKTLHRLCRYTIHFHLLITIFTFVP